jgi:hypothetical protein
VQVAVVAYIRNWIETVSHWERALSECSLLKFIRLPASLQMIDGSALAQTRISPITVEAGNRYFRVVGDFLLDFDGVSVIRYFGSDSTVTLSNHIEILGQSSFDSCHSVCSLTFESGSRLTRIEANAFDNYYSVRSICLPASLQVIDGSALTKTRISPITVEEGNQHFHVVGDFCSTFMAHQSFDILDVLQFSPCQIILEGL